MCCGTPGVGGVGFMRGRGAAALSFPAPAAPGALPAPSAPSPGSGSPGLSVTLGCPGGSQRAGTESDPLPLLGVWGSPGLVLRPSDVLGVLGLCASTAMEPHRAQQPRGARPARAEVPGRCPCPLVPADPPSPVSAPCGEDESGRCQRLLERLGECRCDLAGLRAPGSPHAGPAKVHTRLWVQVLGAGPGPSRGRPVAVPGSGTVRQAPEVWESGTRWDNGSVFLWAGHGLIRSILGVSGVP